MVVGYCSAARVAVASEGRVAMSEPFLDLNVPALQGNVSKLPQDLPHGLIAPPSRVVELVAAEKAKFGERFTPEVEVRLLNEWTLQYYFEYLGHEVLYRRTTQGPEVLAVGFDEIFARTNGMDPRAMVGLATWMP
jgi:hypothetical protein